MVRPNQIIDSDVRNSTLTFIMFARDEEVAERRVLLANFPGKFIGNMLGGGEMKQKVSRTELVSEGLVNRYAVTVSIQ